MNDQLTRPEKLVDLLKDYSKADPKISELFSSHDFSEIVSHVKNLHENTDPGFFKRLSNKVLGIATELHLEAIRNRVHLLEPNFERENPFDTGATDREKTYSMIHYLLGVLACNLIEEECDRVEATAIQKVYAH